MAKSRAVLQLPNETLVHLDKSSVFTLRAIEPEKPAWLEFLHGALHVISRVPRAEFPPLKRQRCLGRFLDHIQGMVVIFHTELGETFV